MAVYSTIEGNNAELIAKVCELYLGPDDMVADVTYGKGAFWKTVGEAQVTATDKYSLPPDRQMDFAKLKYVDGQFTIVVFDPPYIHTPGEKYQNNATYNNSETHKDEGSMEKYHKAVVQRYRRGMCEAARVASRMVWVKCQDEVCSGYQWYTHIEVFNIAQSLGLYARDLFVLKQKGLPTIQHKQQQHARKNHSYLWVFEKLDTKRQRQRFNLGV